MKNNLNQIMGDIYLMIRRSIERLRGIDFIDSVDIDEIGIDKTIGNRYDISNIRALRQILKQCEITSQDVFVDFGCGKGAVLALAAEYSFHKVIGVEISKKLVDIAINNLNRLRVNKAEIVCKDAREYKDIDEITYFYFFNPFPECVFRIVMKNIKESYLKNKRKIVIIYYNPVCEQIIIDTDIFVKKQEIHMKNVCAQISIYNNI